MSDLQDILDAKTLQDDLDRYDKSEANPDTLSSLIPKTFVDAARRIANLDRKAAHIIAESIDGLPENAKMWHAIADDIVNAALGITTEDDDG